MIHITSLLSDLFSESFNALYGEHPDKKLISVQKTRKEFNGDYTINVFAFLKITKKSPENTAKEIGDTMINLSKLVSQYEIVKGFLNISINNIFFLEEVILKNIIIEEVKNKQKYVIEFSSPNTNKPLHLGHIRNNLLGDSIARLLSKVGHEVIKVNLVNDRGIHICKSMLAWQKWGDNSTPETANRKGDKLVGDFYVKFSQELKKEVEELKIKGISEEQAEKESQLMKETRQMLNDWENNKPEVIDLWKKMNAWVYKGFNTTYKKLGITFDKIYYESDTWLTGKDIVNEGLNKNAFYKHSNNSIRVDLTNNGLDEKILLRSDGTSVYITQDIGTAVLRQKEYNADSLIYVVGNEQIYHFQVLKLVLGKLGYEWSEKIYHLSYGMVELPEGKMKSREGTVVDADDLIEEMIATAAKTSEQSGKLINVNSDESQKIYNTIAIGALKYFILKVDPKKNMLFDPKESIDFEGNTGPFIQYGYTRIASILRKAEESGVDVIKKINIDNVELKEIEKEILKNIHDFSLIVNTAAEELNPALLANYLFNIAKTFNQFYHECPVLKETNSETQLFRIQLCKKTAEVIKQGMSLLGIEVPEKM